MKKTITFQIWCVETQTYRQGTFTDECVARNEFTYCKVNMPNLTWDLHKITVTANLEVIN